MMILRSAPPSPFGRKVKIAADILGLSDKIEIVASDTNNPDDPLRRGLPLADQFAAVADLGVAANDAERPDACSVTDAGAILDDGCLVDISLWH